jgi:hypothetical protein
MCEVRMMKVITRVALAVTVMANAGVGVAGAAPTEPVAKVSAALEAHGMTPCDDWARKSPALRGGDRGQRASDRLYNITKPCPPFDPALGGVPDTPDVVDGLITVVVFKDSKTRRHNLKHWADFQRFAYAYGKTTLITLQLFAPPQLDDAFVAAMEDLGARRVSEQKPPAT